MSHYQRPIHSSATVEQNKSEGNTIFHLWQWKKSFAVIFCPGYLLISLFIVYYTGIYIEWCRDLEQSQRCFISDELIISASICVIVLLLEWWIQIYGFKLACDHSSVVWSDVALRAAVAWVSNPWYSGNKKSSSVFGWLSWLCMSASWHPVKILPPERED